MRGRRCVQQSIAVRGTPDDVFAGNRARRSDAVLDDVAAWQARPLEPVYPLVFFDALRVKIRDEGLVRNKAIHIALGVRADGTKEILGLWLEQNEGAKFWTCTSHSFIYASAS